MSDDALCPHCGAVLLADAAGPYPARPVACRSCRLLVGTGRARGHDGRPLSAPRYVRAIRSGTRIGTGIDAPALPAELIRAVARGIDDTPAGRRA